MNWSKDLGVLKQLLTYPGNGVFTVQTAKENKEKLTNALYGKDSDPNEKWSSGLENLASNKLPVIFGIPSDAGGGIQRGANWGPLFIRNELVNDKFYSDKAKVYDLGDVRVIPHFTS